MVVGNWIGWLVITVKGMVLGPAVVVARGVLVGIACLEVLGGNAPFLVAAMSNLLIYSFIVYCCDR
jgi:hypothetical protein